MRSLGVIAIFFAFVMGGNLAAAENALPRVLILGDQIYQQLVSELQNELKGRWKFIILAWSPGWSGTPTPR